MAAGFKDTVSVQIFKPVAGEAGIQHIGIGRGGAYYPHVNILEIEDIDRPALDETGAMIELGFAEFQQQQVGDGDLLFESRGGDVLQGLPDQGMFGGFAELDKSRIVAKVIEEILYDIAEIVGGLQQFFEFGEVGGVFFHTVSP